MTKKTYSAEQEAYNQIKRAIMLKKLLPGQQLSEDWISKNLKMSRTPVRAAFKQLEQERVIKIVQRRGAFVNEPSNKEIRDVFNIRILLESYAAKLATKVITDDHIKELKLLSGKIAETYKNEDFEEFVKLNGLIHEMPARITRNECLKQQISSLINWSDCYLVLKDPFYKQTAETAKNISEHNLIISAFESGIPERVEKAVRDHLESTLDGLEQPKSIFD